MSNTNKPKVAVIGGGPGGYAAAFMAADEGCDVTLIDLEKNPGGVCLYRGCIPSKALLHVAEIITEAKEAEYYGLTFDKPDIDIDKLRDAKNDIVQKMTGGLGQLSKQRKVTYLQGRATFQGSQKINVDLVDGNKETVEPDYTILATGSRPATLPNIDAESKVILDSTSALEVEKIPKTLLVIGGGYIGLELGQVYAALGAKVTVVEMMDSLLPGADKDLVRPLAKRCEEFFENIYLKTKVADINLTSRSAKVIFEGENAPEKEQSFERVLVSVGRKPNSENLGLENTSVKTTNRGFVRIDGQRRTDDKHIYAIGDIAGDPMLAHKAAHEGRVAVEAILGKKSVFEPNAIPAVVFTDPHVAWCGVMENDAKEQGRDVTVSRFPWAASGRATTLHRSDGMTKIISDAETNRVVGVGIVGPGAGELIAEGVLAVEMGALAEDVAHSIHPHPTLSETVMESAEMIFGTSVHYYKKSKK